MKHAPFSNGKWMNMGCPWFSQHNTVSGLAELQLLKEPWSVGIWFSFFGVFSEFATVICWVVSRFVLCSSYFKKYFRHFKTTIWDFWEMIMDDPNWIFGGWHHQKCMLAQETTQAIYGVNQPKCKGWGFEHEMASCFWIPCWISRLYCSCQWVFFGMKWVLQPRTM